MALALRERIACRLAAVRYQFKKLFLLRIRDEAQRVAKERRALRMLLRQTPYWLEGHLRFGMLEAITESRATESRDTRAVAAVRVSAKAALKLLTQQTLPEAEKRSYQLQATFLLGMSHFLLREFEKAADFFYEVLDPAQAEYVEVELGLLCMEYAAFTALALGDEARALRYFEALPEQRHNAEMQSSLDYLRQKLAENSAA